MELLNKKKNWILLSKSERGETRLIPTQYPVIVVDSLSGIFAEIYKKKVRRYLTK